MAGGKRTRDRKLRRARVRRLGRRSFIGGVGGAAVALPLLEIMEPASAKAANGGSPCRFFVALQGIAQSGRNSPSSAAFAPLDPVRSDVTFVSGVTIPSSGNPGPGGKPLGPFHPKVKNPLLTGFRSTSAHSPFEGPSADQLVAARWAGSTRFDSLAYRVQPESYGGGKGVMSHRLNGSEVTPIASPRLAYEQLFTGFMPPTGGGGGGGTMPAPPSPLQKALEQDRSVLDLVRGRAQDLMGLLGVGDRRRVEQHFEEIRALEQRLQTVPGPGGSPPGGSPTGGSTAACNLPAAPGADPTHPGANWSGEDVRARVLADLVHMAFACDLTRSASYMISYLQSQMSAQHISGFNLDIHECTHTNDSQQSRYMDEITAWHVDQFAYLVGKLRDTPEGAGTLLDHTVMVMQFEGVRSHSSDNMTFLLAGRGDVLRMGETINAGGAHPCQLMATAMHSVGVEESLGEVPGTIPALFR